MNEEMRKKVKDYILADYHRIEDFTDLEICCGKDITKTENIVNLYVGKYLTDEDIEKMYSEIQRYDIDLMKWGIVASNREYDFHEKNKRGKIKNEK